MNNEDKLDMESIIAQEDPIVLYIIVNYDLGMGVGKTAAQVGHAVEMVNNSYYELKKTSAKLQYQVMQYQNESAKTLYADMSRKLSIMGEYMNSGHRKVVLKAESKDWVKLKEEIKDMYLVRDAGLTEIAPGSETCIGLWPLRKSQANKIIKRLQVLK
jgi:PTH2 family peptidyl-tRNA hydrolase